MTAEDNALVIRGTIDFGQPVVPGEIHVRLLDTGRMDTGALTLAELVIPPARAPSRCVAFALGRPAPASGGRLGASVWVRMSGGPEITAGDYITMESYPVAAEPGTTELDLRVHIVES